MHSSSPEPVNFFGAQSSLGGAQFSFEGAQAVIWGGTAPECPPWRRAWRDDEKNLNANIIPEKEMTTMMVMQMLVRKKDDDGDAIASFEKER